MAQNIRVIYAFEAGEECTVEMPEKYNRTIPSGAERVSC